MDKVARLPDAQRKELFSETAARMKLPPGLIEKDFWVCWTIKHLFSVPEFKGHLLFKGGTTLSKVFSVIKRFSEDIDLAVDWEMLGFKGDRSPLQDLTRKKHDARLLEMRETCKKYIANDFLGTLQKRIDSTIAPAASCRLEVDAADGQIVNFFYPTITDRVAYVRPAVRLELGTHAEFIPRDRYVIKPYAADHFPRVFEDASCPVTAIKAERTFWEKVTILHQEHHRTSAHQAPDRYSRHYYDVFMLASDPTIRKAALADPGLLKRVVTHKERFFRSAWARYDLASPATFQLQPSEAWRDYLHKDYEKMKVMLFGEVPIFEEILAGLQNLETDIRKMGQETQSD